MVPELLSFPVILASLVLALIYYLCTINFNYWKNKNVPYEKPLPFFGNFIHVALRKQHLGERTRELYDKFRNAPYVGVYMFGTPYLMLKSPDLLRKVLIKDFNVFADKTLFADENIDPYSANNLFTANNQVWKAMRVKLSPIFTSGKVKLMSQLINDCAKNLNMHLDKCDRDCIDILNVFTRYTVDVISSCAFGIDANCLSDDNSIILKKSQQLIGATTFIRTFSIFSYFFMPNIVKLFKLTFSDTEASKFFQDVLEKTLIKRKQENIERTDLINLLGSLKATKSTKDEYVIDNNMKMSSQALVFFTAGNTTTSKTLTFLLYEISSQPQMQKRLRTEIINTIKNYENKITYESLQDMKYIDMVINETLRKYPLTNTIDRRSTEKYTFEETGLTIEEGTAIMIPIVGIHFDPENFPNPEVFDPERFNEENKKKIKPYTFIPFGAGSRNCIGERFAILTMKIAVAHIMKDFEFSFFEKNPKPLKMDPKNFFAEPSYKILLKAIKTTN